MHYNPFIMPEFTQYTNKPVNTIFELGCHTGLYTGEIQRHYNPFLIHSFECNPDTINICRANLAILKNVHLHEYAVLDYDGETTFFPIDDADVLQKGSSSVYLLGKEKNIKQKEITVNCITLDTFCKNNDVKKIDLICADIEGAEHLAFKNQEILHSTDYIITEVQVDPNWKKGYPTIKDLESSLGRYNFKLKKIIYGPTTPNIAGDALYVRED